MGGKRKEDNSRGVTAGDDIYELRLRKDGDGFDLMSDSFRCGAIWYSGPTQSAMRLPSRDTGHAGSRTTQQSACWTPAAL
jgi:hypothetical protein